MRNTRISEERNSTQFKMMFKIEKAKGNEAYNAGDYIKACEHYSNYIKYSADPVAAYNNRAQASKSQQIYVHAVEKFA